MFALSLCACGAQPPPDAAAEPEVEGTDCTIEGDARFFPIAAGDMWRYRVTRLNTGEAEEKMHLVGELEDIGGDKSGVMAFPVTSTKASGSTTTWQEDTGTSVLRHREDDRAGANYHDEYYEPHKIRLDESEDRLVEGATYQASFEQRKTNIATLETVIETREETWTVVRHGEEVTVPAGTFCTLQVRRQTTVNGEPGSDKLYWYARGVGKVKERAGNRREELLEADVE